MKFCWTTIHVKDMDRSLAFYQEIAGLKLNRRTKAGPQMELAFLGEGDTQLELIADEGHKDVRFGADISIGFVIESTSQFIEFLKTKDIEIQSGPFQPNPFIRFFYVQDPDGLKIQFIENLAP